MGIQELLAQRQVLKDAFKAEMDEFREKMAAQRKAKNERYQEQRAQQQAEWDKMRAEKEVEKLETNPHLSQITLIDQTIAFCKGLMPQDKAEQKEEKLPVMICPRRQSNTTLKLLSFSTNSDLKHQ